MSQPSQKLDEAFELRLSERWQDWFNGYGEELALPGMMRQALSAEQLCQPAPEQFWPGFMLPDSIPVLGNKYGDCICARVTKDSEIGELIYWYHGGGDWIPVGHTLAEVVLHDAVDQFRQVRKQMLRGASESRIDSKAGVLMRLVAPEMQTWLSLQLSADTESGQPGVVVKRLVDMLSAEDYVGSLKLMQQAGWASSAVGCDLVEQCLQKPIEPIADQRVAQAANIPWFPDYVQLLFDTERGDDEVRRIILDTQGHRLSEWPEQDWLTAFDVAQAIASKRTDLGWTATILGWQQEREGNIGAAIAAYAQGLKASSFTDQAVRLNSHADSEESGKFSIARLVALRDQIPPRLLNDGYLQLFLKPLKRSLLQEVSEYWLNLARESEGRGDFALAYDLYYAAGWDMGLSRLSDYAEILGALGNCAARAGWSARARVANTHLQCLVAKAKR